MIMVTFYMLNLFQKRKEKTIQSNGFTFGKTFSFFLFHSLFFLLSISFLFLSVSFFFFFPRKRERGNKVEVNSW